MKKRTKLKDIKGWIIGVTIMIILVIIMPWAYWTNHQRSINLSERGKTVEATIIKLEGLKKNKMNLKYTIKGKSYTGWRDDYSNEINVGDKLKIVYDSIDPSNFKIIK
jgi:hypothetical protein